MALGEETSSSLKRPAAWAALAGMRPTPGLVSRTGMWDGHPVPTAQMGPMTRSMADLATLLDAMVGYDPEDPITALGVGHVPPTYTAFLDKNGLKGARVGVIREPLGGNSRPESEDFKKVDAVFENALDELRRAGAAVVDVVIPDLKELMSKRATDRSLNDEGLRVYLSRNPNSGFKGQEDIDNHPAMATSFKATTRQGRGRAADRGAADPKAVLESVRAREQLMINIAKVMADHQLQAVVFKSVEHQPTRIAEATTPPYRSNGGVVSINTFLIHAPIVTVPMGFTSDGIPAGITFMGLPFSEPTLIKLGYAYEQATHHRVPPQSTPSLVGEPNS